MFLPPGFDKVIALEAANLVCEAYRQYGVTPLGNASAPAGYQLLASLNALAKPESKPEEKELFGFVVRNLTTGNVFVVFRGTDSTLDLIADVTIDESEFPGWGAVHKGFNFVYSQFPDSIRAALNAAPGTPVFVTGHSMGAALSILATAGVSDLGRNPVTYAYASPRVARPDFAKRFETKNISCWRIVNTEDIVNDVPFATLDVTGASGGNLLIRLLVNEIPKLDFSHVGVEVPHTAQRGSIVDNHSMDKYRDTIASA